MLKKHIKLFQFLLGFTGADIDGEWGPKSKAKADALINDLARIK